MAPVLMLIQADPPPLANLLSLIMFNCLLVLKNGERAGLLLIFVIASCFVFFSNTSFFLLKWRGESYIWSSLLIQYYYRFMLFP